MSDTQTPRTDALASDPHLKSTNVLWTHARHLERELSEAREQRDRLAEALAKLNDLSLCGAAYELIENALAACGRSEKEPESEWSEWVEWGGGECPVSVELTVCVRFRNGGENHDLSAGDWHWGHNNDIGDIIAYRVLKVKCQVNGPTDRTHQQMSGENASAPDNPADHELAETRRKLASAERREADQITLRELNLKQLAEVREQRDRLAEECRALLHSEAVQTAWPLDGTRRAEKPSDTNASADVCVKFRHLLAINAALSAQEQAEPEWIEWDGGVECPLPAKDAVCVKFRNGRENMAFSAGEWAWDHYGIDGDIVAYRVLKGGNQ